MKGSVRIRPTRGSLEQATLEGTSDGENLPGPGAGRAAEPAGPPDGARGRRSVAVSDSH
jgi:hypothetical protein